MAEEKESTSIPLSQAVDPEDPAKSPPSSPNSSTRKVTRQISFYIFLPRPHPTPPRFFSVNYVFDFGSIWFRILIWDSEIAVIYGSVD